MSTVDEDVQGRPGLPVAGAFAGWWQRVAASLVDGLAVGIPTVALGVAAGGFSVRRDGVSGRLLVQSSTVYVVAGFVISVAYLLGTLCRRGSHNGQSLGKQLVGIRVVRDDGHYVGVITVIVREVIGKFGPSYLLRLLPGSGIWLLVSLLDDLWPLWDPENRALHDFVAQTHVIRA